MFVARRQFVSASGLEEITVHVRLPSDPLVTLDGTVVYPATVWDNKSLLVFAGYYASIDGTIWSGRQNCSLRKLSPTKSGRVGVIVDDGKQRMFCVHRVVASTFLSDVRHAGQDEVDHIDVDPTNNALVNLRWCTKKQNTSNRCPVKAVAHRKRTRELLSKPVQQLCPETGAVIAEYSSATAAANATGILHIGEVISKRYKTAGGFSWQFAPREMTLEDFKSRGFEVVGGTLEEAPYLYFSADLKVYNDDKCGKMYEIPINHGCRYPYIRIPGWSWQRPVHVVVAALRGGYASLAAFGEYMASNRFVVRHDDDADKSDWWNCKVGTRSENAMDAVRNGRNTGKTAARPVVIRLSPDPTADVWKYDGVRQAEFPSFAAAARALGGLSSLKDLRAGIANSARRGISFSLTRDVKAWAFG
jgi:hypothetical protein